MDNQVQIETRLKGLSSEDAANLLMEIFPIDAPNYSEAFQLMARRSWKKTDQRRLARYYLLKTPFATSTPYEVFASFMSLPTLISLVEEALADKPIERPFIAYHVTPVLKKHVKTDKDRQLVDRFVNEWNCERMTGR
nr:hypothetical protein [uncultured Duganella sp.]